MWSRAAWLVLAVQMLAAQVGEAPWRMIKSQRTAAREPLNAERAYKRARAVELDRGWRQTDKAFRAELALFDDARFTVAFGAGTPSGDGRTRTWVGHVEGSRFGEAYLVEHDQVLSGHVFLEDGRVFELVTLASGAWVREVDLTTMGERNDDARPAPEEFTASPIPLATVPPAERVADEASTIDVMVVYTPAVRNRAGGQAQIEALIREGIAVANQSYENSGIRQRLRLAHMQAVNYTESGDMGKDLDAITSPTDGVMDEVHALRNQYGADFVSLWVEYSDQAGIGWMNRSRSTNFERLAFHCTSRLAAVSNRTFPHELGHNMGAEHDVANSSGTGMFPYSYGLQQTASAPFFRTVMAYSCANVNCPRVSYFSNPDVTFQGRPTGVAITATNPANNRLTFDNSLQWTANFRRAAGAPPETVSVTPQVVETPAGGGTATLRITASGAWRIENPNGWIRLSSTNGTGNASVVATVAANLDAAARAGVLQVGNASVTVRQAGNEQSRCVALALASGPAVTGSLTSSSCTSPTRAGRPAQWYGFAGSAGQQIILSASSSQFDPFLTLIGPDGVVVQTDDNGGGGTAARIPAGNGSFALPQTGSYVVEVSGSATGTFSIQLTNAPATGCAVTLSPAAVRVAAGPGQASVNVTAPAGCPWSATAGAAWLRLNTSSGAGNGTVFFDVLANPASAERTAAITVAGRTVPVTQAAAAAGCQAVPVSIGQTVQGTLSATGCRAQFRGGEYFAARYSFEGAAGQRVQITSRSAAVDSFLYLLGPDGRVLETDDDSGGGLDSKIPGDEEFLGLPTGGRYVVEVTTFDPRSAGAFELTVAEAPAAGPGRGLVSGEPFEVTLPAVTRGTLFTDDAYEITVPEGAAELVITARAENLEHDIDLYVRYGQPPDVANNRAVADYRSERNNGDERVEINRGSTPPLRPGRYFVGLGQFALNVESRVTITATVARGSTSRFTLREAVTSRTTPTGCATPPASSVFRPADARAVFYFIGEGNAGGVARVEFIDPEGNRIVNETFDPQTEAGTFCRWAWVTIAGTPNTARLGRWTVRALWDETLVTTTNFVLENAVTTPANAIGLTSGQARPFALPAVGSPTLFTGAQMYRIDVPASASRLEINLVTTTPNVDLDLYVRANEAPALVGTTVSADYASESLSGNERLVIDRSSQPPLRAGTYFIALASYTTGVAAQGTLTATIDGAGGGGVLRQALITTTQPSRTSCEAPPANDLVRPSDARVWAWFSVQGQQGETARVEWRDPEGQTASLISFQPLPEAGTYCFDTSLQIAGTLVANRFGRWSARIIWGERLLRELFFTLDNPALPGVALTDGVPRSWSLPAYPTATLMPAANAFRLNVPNGALRLEARLETSTPGVDVDLFARYNTAPVVSGGRVLSDYASTGEAGDEFIRITPTSAPVPLQGGTWHFSLAVFTLNRATQGTLTVTVFMTATDEPLTVKIPVRFDEMPVRDEAKPKARRPVAAAERLIWRREE